MIVRDTHLLPGLVDAHVHLGMDFAGDAPEPGPERIAHNAERLRAAGIAAARDAGAPAWSPPIDVEGVVAAGRFLAPAGGFVARIYDPVAPADLIDIAVAEIRAGLPWVKVIADFPGPDGDWFAPRVGYDLDLVGDLVAAVHAAGGRVMTHVSGPIVADLVRLGVDSIEHGPGADGEVLEEMAARGTIWTPTVATIVAHVGPLEHWRTTIPLAVRLGVPVVAGSDELPAGELWREVVALHEHGGLDPEAALAAATDVPRRALGLDSPAGAVACPGDPHDDLTRLRDARPVARAQA